MEDPVKLQVGVKLLLKDKEGRYLILRRSLEKYPEVKNRWDIPGGRIDPGTDLLSNLARELKEETGLFLIGTPMLVAAQDIIPRESLHVVRLTYSGEAEGSVFLDLSEHDQYEWRSLRELEAEAGLDPYVRTVLTSKQIS